MDYFLEAEYESGYVHSSQLQDISPYEAGRNIFYDILHKLPEQAHGRMVRYSLVTPENTFSVDWTILPDNARPIHLVDREIDTVGGMVTEERLTGLRFGYQWNDENGKNHKEVTEIK